MFRNFRWNSRLFGNSTIFGLSEHFSGKFPYQISPFRNSWNFCWMESASVYEQDVPRWMNSACVQTPFYCWSSFHCKPSPDLTCDASISINIRSLRVIADGCDISIIIHSSLCFCWYICRCYVQWGNGWHKHKVLADWLKVFRLCLCQPRPRCT